MRTPNIVLALILMGLAGNLSAQTCAPLPEAIPTASGCFLELGLLKTSPIEGIDLKQGVDIVQIKQLYGEPIHSESWHAPSSWDAKIEVEFLKLEYEGFNTVLSRPLDGKNSHYKVHSLSISDEKTILPCSLELNRPVAMFKQALGSPRETSSKKQLIHHRYHWNHFYCTEQGWRSEEAVIVLFENSKGNVNEISWDYLSQ